VIDARATEALDRKRPSLTARAQHINDSLQHHARHGLAPAAGFEHVVPGCPTSALWNQGSTRQRASDNFHAANRFSSYVAPSLISQIRPSRDGIAMYLIIYG
jgi:hypothetical protein